MGSWFGTCGVSQLPIKDNDDVAILFMKENDFNDVDYSGCVHSDNFYVPVSPAIFGKYDDYGRVTKVKADNRIVDILYGKQDDYNDIGKIIDKQSEENKIFIMLVHLNIYKKIISKFGNRKKFFTQGLTLEEHFKNELVNHVKLRRQERIESEKSDKLSPFNPELEHSYRFLGNSLEFYQNFYNNEEIYDDNIKEDFLIDEIVDLLIFRDAMQDSRKLWIPQAGQGSQDLDYEVNEIIGSFVEKQKQEKDEW